MPRPKLILALESKQSILIGLWRFSREEFLVTDMKGV
jgi:hypothetical protein